MNDRAKCVILSPPITALILRVGGRLASCNIRFIVHRSRGISRPTAFQIARNARSGFSDRRPDRSASRWQREMFPPRIEVSVLCSPYCGAC